MYLFNIYIQISIYKYTHIHIFSDVWKFMFPYISISDVWENFLI